MPCNSSGSCAFKSSQSRQLILEYEFTHFYFQDLGLPDLVLVNVS